MTTFTVPVKITMTDQQLREWAQDNDVELSAVPDDVGAYLLHNLLMGSSTLADYTNAVNVEPAQAQAPEPSDTEDLYANSGPQPEPHFAPGANINELDATPVALSEQFVQAFIAKAQADSHEPDEPNPDISFKAPHQIFLSNSWPGFSPSLKVFQANDGSHHAVIVGYYTKDKSEHVQACAPVDLTTPVEAAHAAAECWYTTL